MENIYILMVVALAVLAVIDLVVGVSNDAINFLNSAFGSKVISIRNILIIASLGVAFGALTSSGMMEVARKGIFVPGEFYFNEIIYIFLAVMITDILLLDVFNTLGMPTSTTVSIVFELLGAAVAMAFIKISMNENETASAIWKYINYEKATLIILGILLSVIVAFTIGAIVQFISRLIYSFNLENKKSYVNALFGGFALTSITYFVFVKGLKGTPFYGDIKYIIEDSLTQIIVISFTTWTLVSELLIRFFKADILKIIVGFGTFSLAMAFAGNDLVNFIGVPIAGWNAYEVWHSSGKLATEFSMESLAGKVPSNTIFLVLAGLIMVITIWFSKKARSVIKTGVDLSRQGEGAEKFQPTDISRITVRGAIAINKVFELIIPKSIRNWIDSRFQVPVIPLPKSKTYEMPAFDKVRASVNLVVAGILISIATSFKLPLSTTYVTFMVAMGTSFADRAWGRESAVYRVAGVLNVIAGWFGTALIAFSAAAIALYVINLGGITAVSLLLIFVFLMIGRNYIRYSKKQKEKKVERNITRNEIITIKGVIDESSEHIAAVVDRVRKLFSSVVNDLSLHDLNKLKKTDKHVGKLNQEVDDLKDEVFYFIKSLDETSVAASRFYILVLSYLQDVAQSISYISKASFKHVNNNHKQLKKDQLKDLKSIDDELEIILNEIGSVFIKREFDSLGTIIEDKQNTLNRVSESIERQIKRIRTEETSPKNTTLYFSILLETQDLINALINLLKLYEDFYLSAVAVGNEHK
ncbi:inorganic phosphate transporter [Lutibacter sp.]|uniref:inorganic phosphate transporter n=1 Tax=Lutibacter sp. TaxID=1925666 RepID=UPI0025C2A9DF|nr:inorganic phosphate transporter [Lutibacter sp.]MCF6166996.1 inorganic phosphate transporter [Lutibacter sp.]